MKQKCYKIKSQNEGKHGGKQKKKGTMLWGQKRLEKKIDGKCGTERGWRRGTCRAGEEAKEQISIL